MGEAKGCGMIAAMRTSGESGVRVGRARRLVKGSRTCPPVLRPYGVVRAECPV